MKNHRAIKSGLAGSLLTAALFSGSALASDALDGMWRGKLEVQEGVFLTVGYTIRGGEVTMDSPNQGMFDKEPTSFAIHGNRLELSDNQLSASFDGEFSGDTLTGTFTQGRAFPLTLHRLDDEAKARLEFEGRYAGDLVVNQQSKLPLQVNVAVVHDGYYATLDSPAQQSFGIPIEDFSIDEAQMSFRSAMLSASYSATWQDGEYQGEFSQGQPLPLSLKRVEDGEPQVSVPKSQLGEHGGAIAVLTGGEVNTRYFQDHNAQSSYEIGSVTKTMVAYLLANALVDEQVDATTEVSELWPSAPDGVPVMALATHHSGVPRLPEDLFTGADPADPYAHYDVDRLNDALSQLTLTQPNYEYSNFGFGLLGELLAWQSETTFGDLMESALFEPAQMANSYVAMTGSSSSDVLNLAQGHDLFGEQVAPWHFQALAGAGGVVSTLPDMVNYVNFMRAGVATADPIVMQMLAVQEQLGDCCEQALAWIIQEDDEGNKYAWHNGQTGGYYAYVAFYLDGSRAVVVLNNQSVAFDSDALALLTGTQQLSDLNLN